MWHIHADTVEHIISEFKMLAADKYLNKHNQAATQLHLDICRHYGIKINAQHWNQHNPDNGQRQSNHLVQSPDHNRLTHPCNKLDKVRQEKDSERCVIIGGNPE